jgi:hypothetical protein
MLFVVVPQVPNSVSMLCTLCPGITKLEMHDRVTSVLPHMHSWPVRGAACNL